MEGRLRTLHRRLSQDDIILQSSDWMSVYAWGARKAYRASGFDDRPVDQKGAKG